MLRRLILRDAFVALLTSATWTVDARLRHEHSARAIAVSIVTGLLTGVCGYLAHEWGHLAASLGSGSVVHYPPPGRSPLSFHFDSARNTRTQFYWMSAGGYLASLVGLALIVAFVPHDGWSGWIAMGVAAAGTLATFVLEIPTTVGVARGAPLPTGFAYEKP